MPRRMTVVTGEPVDRDAAMEHGISQLYFTLSPETRRRVRAAIRRVVEAGAALDANEKRLQRISSRLLRMKEPTAQFSYTRKTLTDEQKAYYRLLAEETRLSRVVNEARAVINGGAIPCP